LTKTKNVEGVVCHRVFIDRGKRATKRKMFSRKKKKRSNDNTKEFTTSFKYSTWNYQSFRSTSTVVQRSIRWTIMVHILRMFNCLFVFNCVYSQSVCEIKWWRPWKTNSSVCQCSTNTIVL